MISKIKNCALSGAFFCFGFINIVMLLNELNIDSCASVVGLICGCLEKKRLMQLGFYNSGNIKVVKISPSKNFYVVFVNGKTVIIKGSVAKLIKVS